MVVVGQGLLIPMFPVQSKGPKDWEILHGSPYFLFSCSLSIKTSHRTE
jgi:hypothetical protein